MSVHMANTRRRQSERGLTRVEITAFPSSDVVKLRKIAEAMKRQAAEKAELMGMIDEAFSKFGTRSLDNVSPPEKDIRLKNLRHVADTVAECLMRRGGREGFVLGRRIRHRLTGAAC